jgi:CRP-like cAMP-binding protein
MSQDPLAHAVDSLRRVPFFSQLSQDEIDLLSRALVRCSYSAGQPIFHIGDPGKVLYLISSGKVKILYPTLKGQEVVLAILGAHDFFGELALFDGSSRSATASALEKTVAYTLDRELFLDCLRRNPELALQLLSDLARRFRQVNDQISALASLDISGRLARRLLQLAAEHGEPSESGMRGALRIPLSLTQTELADMTGATRVSINKALRHFREEGWITYTRRELTICNPDALEGVASQMTLYPRSRDDSLPGSNSRQG